MSHLLRTDFDRRITAAAVLFSAGCIPGAMAAAAAESHVFDLPADVAAKTLQRFAEQAGAEVVFAANSTARIRTNAVHGHFTPQEAIERLLHGTGLIAERSARTGAFTVLRAPPPRPSREATTPDRKHSSDQAKPNAMDTSVAKPKNLLTLVAGWLAIVASPGEAQTVPPAPPAPTEEETLVLSPFTVQSDRDTGYQATSTLAGTRLNTPLKDLGAAISIYTKDFLEDIAATNSSELLIYATGMEAAGAGGNFSGGGNDINAENVVAQAPRSDPQNGTRTRGLAAPNFSRGFFASEISLDSYNTEAVTVNRGPNAILFGVGSPAGVVEQSLLRADLRRDRNRIEVRYGNNDSLRSAVDFNRVLLEKKLALRIAALHDNERYNQRPAFEEKKRIYGAVTFEPFRSTVLRANFESGHIDANRPLTILPANSVSAPWLAAGRPGYDWSFYDDPARNPNASSQVAGPAFEGPFHTVVPFSGTGTVIYSQPGDQVPSLAFHGTTRNTSATAANSIRNQLFHPLVNRDLAADTINFLSTANLFELPASWWTGANVLPGQQPGFKPAGIKVQGFTDFSVFDFKNRMLDESSRQRESFHAFNVALEQRAWRDRVGIELAYDTQRRDRRVKNSILAEGSTNHIRIDTTATLPTGEPNPNFGRPFAEAHGANFPTRLNQRETMRATAFLKYDFKDLDTSWSKWLGRHTLTGLLEHSTIDTITYNNLYAIDGPAARSASAAINQRRPAIVVYLGPSIIGNNNPLQLEAAKIPEIQAGPLGVTSRYFVREANATDPGHFEDGPTSLVETLAAANANREVIKSRAAVLQSYWLRDHLITLVGWRRDEDFFINQNFNPVTNPNDLNDPGRTQAGFDDFSFPSTPPPNVAAEVKSYSAVLRWPRKFIKLPDGTDLSLSYNRSSNFTPAGGRYSSLGGSLPSPEGDTKEYGFAVSAFHDKLTLRVNRFETSVRGQSFNPPAHQNAQWFGLAATARVWAEEANINPHLAAMRNADIDLLFGALPESFRELHNFQVSGTAPNISATTTRVSGATDTTDFVAKGTELELVFNPTRNWRILANVAKQETVQSNMLPGTRELVARLTPVWDQLADRPKNNYPVGWQPGTPLPANVQTYGDWLDQNVFVPLATTLATEGVASAEQRKWRANLVTNYTFGRGSFFGDKLKGWGIGGALRWQDRLGLGYPTGRNPDGSGSIDLAHPYYAPAETNVDAWVSYQRKLWAGKIDWKVQLNVRNLYRDSELIPIGVQPWGEIATVRLAPERRWYLTNTFSF